MDFSLAELCIVAIIAIFALDKKDVRNIIALFSKLKSDLNDFYHNEVEPALEEENYIIDMDGNRQRTYSLEAIKRQHNDAQHTSTVTKDDANKTP